jgi:hypothetical protein
MTDQKRSRQTYATKKSQGTLCPQGSVSVMVFCPDAPKPWLLLSYQWTMFFKHASMFHLQCIFLSETCCSKNAEAAESGHIFPFVDVFQWSVTQSRVAFAAHLAVTIKARACCVRVRNFSSLSCIILALAPIYNIL